MQSADAEILAGLISLATGGNRTGDIRALIVGGKSWQSDWFEGDDVMWVV